MFPFLKGLAKVNLPTCHFCRSTKMDFNGRIGAKLPGPNAINCFLILKNADYVTLVKMLTVYTNISNNYAIKHSRIAS